MSFAYPQLFSLENTPFHFALKYMPNTDLCGDTGGGGSGGTGLTPPCADCIEKMPFAPQDVFDLQWPETISSVTIRLPNGSTVPSAGIVSFEGRRLRISFCHAPPCFSIEINDECTFLAFERVACFVDCETEPSPDNPNPIEPPPVQALPSFVQFEHVKGRSGVMYSTNIVGFTNARYSYTQYPNTPVSYLASSRNGVGGVCGDHLGATVDGSIVQAEITTGGAVFLHWTFDTPSGSIVGYTPSGTYEPAPLPPVITNGSVHSTFIEFIVPPGTHIRARALFDI
jgi:hypothetical protein